MDRTTMACPYLREAVMLSCDACPVKKMLPLDRIATANPCIGEFHSCPMFKEVVARLTAAARESVPAAHTAAFARKDGSR
jgi:hypothetical protein